MLHAAALFLCTHFAAGPAAEPSWAFADLLGELNEVSALPVRLRLLP